MPWLLFACFACHWAALEVCEEDFGSRGRRPSSLDMMDWICLQAESAWWLPSFCALKGNFKDVVCLILSQSKLNFVMASSVALRRTVNWRIEEDAIKTVVAQERQKSELCFSWYEIKIQDMNHTIHTESPKSILFGRAQPLIQISCRAPLDSSFFEAACKHVYW